MLHYLLTKLSKPKFQKNGPVLLCETILISLSCCLATNGKDGRVLKLEKAGPTFSSNLML